MVHLNGAFMILNFANSLYYKFVSGISKIINDKYWLGKRIAQILPPFSRVNRLTFRKSSIDYGGKYIGQTSFDNQTSIIKERTMLTRLRKDNADCFHDDFIEISQMVYFIFCYLFMPSNAEANYIDRWGVFFKALKHDKITSFGKTIKATVDLLTSLNNNNTPPEFANTLENCNMTPPILTEFGVVFDSSGLEFKLLHYTVKIPNSNDHISLVLLEKDTAKYYKLSKINGLSKSDLVHTINNDDYFKFNINEFSNYSQVTEFISEFSMLLIKAINPEYKEDNHPTVRHKAIFDMLHY